MTSVQNIIITLVILAKKAVTYSGGEEWVSTSPFSYSPSSLDARIDPLTTAYLNVTRWSDGAFYWDKTEVGRYGGGYVAPTSGVIVHVTSALDPDDHSGCQLPFKSTTSRGELPPVGEPWIALIKRGKCNFDLKVENAFRSKAVGVLVYNDRDSQTLDKMKLSSDPGRNITAVFTYKWKGEELAKLSANDSKVFVHITIASHSSSRTANINRTSVLFVSITFIILMIISLAWLVFYYVQRFRYIHAKDRLSRRLGNAAKKALSKIPTKNIKVDDNEVQDAECCAVCIEPYKISDTLRILPCAHEFHRSCIDPWLLEHRTCPMCKMDILKHYGFVFTGSQESILQVDPEDIQTFEIPGYSNDVNSPRRVGGISPLPEIRAVVIANRQCQYNDSSMEDSRASSPNEMTPSLPQRNFSTPVSRDLCVSCIAARSMTTSAHIEIENEQDNRDNEEVPKEQISSQT